MCRTEICELIQYAPVTPQVHRFPLLIVPPMINKFYITDLAPGRSMIEYLVSARAIRSSRSRWRNPDARHRDWNLDSYGAAVLDALDAARPIRGASQGQHLRAVLGRHRLLDGGRAPERHRPAGRAGHAVPGRHRARPGAGGHRRRDDRRDAPRPAIAASPAPRLPRRPGAGRGVRLAATRRPDLELLGQQLPAGRDPAAVRHPLLERRHHPAARRPAPRLHRARPVQRADQARRRPRCSARRSTCPRSTSTPT